MKEIVPIDNTNHTKLTWENQDYVTNYEIYYCDTKKDSIPS
ncbi:hypothetical protein [Mobilitalea sibirica]|nr:hypothetical protein [Mobilitalea sibirica]